MNPGRHELACRDVSEQRASQQTDHRLASLQTDLFDLAVCKLVHFCKRLRELIDCFAYSLSLFADWLFCKSGREIEGEICRLVPVGRRVCRMVPVCRLSKQVCKLDHESANLAELADWSTESAD